LFFSVLFVIIFLILLLLEGEDKYTLHEMHESEGYYGNRRATIYKFGRGVRIIGFKKNNNFEIRVLTIGMNPRQRGIGKQALEMLRPKYEKITVSEIYDHALPFWLKMKERGLINNLGSVKASDREYTE